MNNSIIFCEGESEIEFLNSAKRLGLLKVKNIKIKKIKSFGKIRRARSIFPSRDYYILIHDTDNWGQVEREIKDLMLLHKEKFILLKNKPNLDFAIAEICGRKNKEYTKSEHRDVLTFLKKMFGKDKKITLEEIFTKKFKIEKHIKNNNFMIFQLFK